MVPLSIMLSASNLGNFQSVLPSHLNALSLRSLLDGAVGFMGYGGNGQLYDELLPKFKNVTKVYEKNSCLKWNGTNNLYRITVGYHWYIVDAVLAYAHTIEKVYFYPPIQSSLILIIICRWWKPTRTTTTVLYCSKSWKQPTLPVSLAMCIIIVKETGRGKNS